MKDMKKDVRQCDILRTKYTREQNMRKKIYSEEEEEMRVLRNNGFTIRELAEKYNICSATVRYHTDDSAREKRREDNKVIYQRNKDKPEYKQAAREAAMRNVARKLDLYNKGELSIQKKGEGEIMV